jgi:predicted RNase H-like HicB family nuclease
MGEAQRNPPAAQRAARGMDCRCWVPLRCTQPTISNDWENPMREFSVIIEKDEDGYFVASVPALRGCHTQAKSLDTLMKRIKEAIELCLEVEEPISNEFIGVQKVAVNS